MTTYHVAIFGEQYAVIKITSDPQYYVIAICPEYADAAAIVVALS